MIYARLFFTIHEQPKTALLTDRGWTIFHADSGMISLLNHICPLPEFPKDHADLAEQAAARAACADRAAELLRGTVEHS